MASRLSSTAARSARADASMSQRTAYAERMSSAYERGEVISIDIAQPIRLRPAELAEAVRQAVNEATALAREAVLAGTEDMPGMAQVQSEVARMQRDVLAGYKADMDRITARLDEL